MISLTNLNAMRSAAAMADSNADIKTSMERLSTGSKINSASDDAAGLAVATKMNTQIIGIAKAIENALDGTNLMSTADGALDEVHGVLQRMRELAMQAANGTQSAGDLIALDNEYQSMNSAIARIGANTEWNGKKIFDGVGFPGETKFQVGVDAGQTIGVVIDKLAISELGKETGSTLVTHPSTPPSAVTTQETFVAHSASAPSAQSTAGKKASMGSDFDGDGDADILTRDGAKEDPFAGTVLLTNNGAGDFSVASAHLPTHFMNNHAGDVAIDIADFDGDGDVDYVTRDTYTNYFVTYLNDGAGNFTEGVQTSIAYDSYNWQEAMDIVAVDIDQDGDADVITRDSLDANFSIYLNDGAGNFSFDRDITTPTKASNNAYGGVALLADDVDGDGDIDIVTMDDQHEHNVQVFLNDGSLNFTRQDSYLEAVHGSRISADLGDLDGDGDIDLVTRVHFSQANANSDSEHRFRVLMNDGSGNFSLHSTYSTRGEMLPGHAGLAIFDADSDGDNDLAIRSWDLNSDSDVFVYKNDGSGNFSFHQSGISDPTWMTQADIVAKSVTPASPSTSAIDFSSLNLSVGDKVTITVPGGSNVSAVMDSNGLSTLLTSLGNSLAAQSSLFTGASNSGGTLTINGLADGSAMPSLSVTLEDGVDTSRLDFNNKNLVEGDQIVIKVSGGTDVQGTIDSNGLDTLLGTLATQLQSQSSLFSAASISSGVLSLTGLTNGAAVADVTVEMNTSASQIGNTSIRTQTVTSAALGSVDKAIEDVSVMRSKYGATLNQLLAAINNLTTISTNASNSKSTVEDADYAQESSNLASAQIRNQGAKATLAQANTDQQLVMKLIKDWL